MPNLLDSLPSQTEPITLSFRYSERDYVRALRTHYASRLRIKTDILVILVLAGSAAYFWNTEGMQMYVGVAGMGLVILSAMLIAAFFILPQRLFRRNPKLHDEYSLAFNDDGIHFRTAHVDSQLAWGLYSHALVDVNSYVLYYGSQFSLIPTRTFKDPEQRQQFDQLISRHIPKITRKDKPLAL